MLRAAVLAARLGFDMDELVSRPSREHRALITKASPARLMEEYYKILRSGYAEASFRALGRVRLLELDHARAEVAARARSGTRSRGSTAYRLQFPSAPPELTNTILIGRCSSRWASLERQPGDGRRRRAADERVSFGMLPVAKQDLERLRQLARDSSRGCSTPRCRRASRAACAHRPAFPDALTWLEIFGDAPDGVEHWQAARAPRARPHARATARTKPARRRADARRRRRRRRPAAVAGAGAADGGGRRRRPGTVKP